MNLRHLSVFHGVAKAGSVNAAARLLHTSQPAVSRELRTLEERRVVACCCSIACRGECD